MDVAAEVALKFLVTAVSTGLGILIGWWLANRDFKKRESVKDEHRRRERAVRKLLDTQRNIGRRIRNALEEFFGPQFLFLGSEEGKWDGLVYRVDIVKNGHHVVRIEVDMFMVNGGQIRWMTHPFEHSVCFLGAEESAGDVTMFTGDYLGKLVDESFFNG